MCPKNHVHEGIFKAGPGTGPQVGRAPASIARSRGERRSGRRRLAAGPAARYNGSAMSPARTPELRRTCAACLALACAACFRDRPSLTCEGPFSACQETSTSGAPASSSSGAPTTTEATTGATTGEPDTSRYFRIDALEIIDPHLFYGAPCADVTGTVNSVALDEQIDAGELNILLTFSEFDLDMLEPSLSEAVSCDVPAGTCVSQPSLAVSVPAQRIDEGLCSTLDPGVIAAINLEALNAPAPICFRTLAAGLSLPIQGSPIELIQAQVAFNFEPLADPAGITNGLLYGFLTRASAEATKISLGMIELNVWDLVVGQPNPSDCSTNQASYLPSADVVDGQEGVWMAVNFTATRVEVSELP